MLTKKALMSTAVAAESLAIEDVFSTWLYTGNGSTQTITNGIDLAGEGGMVWIKARSNSQPHLLFDTIRGVTDELNSNTTDAEASLANSLTAFNADGFSISSATAINFSTATLASWTFRKAKRFFDVVTYTGTGSNRTIAHSLGVVPGCIIVKRTDTASDWQVYHRGNTAAPETDYLVLNSTAATVDDNTRWNDTLPTSTVFSLGTNTFVNASGGTYVAYVYAHDPLGPSGDGSDGLIACGSFTTDGSGNATIDLGWEPQWVLMKSSSSVTNWILADNMRGMNVSTSTHRLYADSSAAEATSNLMAPTARGFVRVNGGVSQTWVYIAIRRGPMREPTSGTEVLGLNARTGTGADATVTGGLTADAVLVKNRGSGVASLFSSRMTGTGYLVTSTNAVEVAAATDVLQANPWDVMDGVKVGTSSTITNASSNTFINYLFKRAPGFFDVVAYTGTGANRTVSHNLGAAPEFMIVKSRSALGNGAVYHTSVGNSAALLLNSNGTPSVSATWWNSASPSSTVFTVGTNSSVNGSTTTYIAYLFASLPGISKVGSYTGNGSNQTINCGFATGARFILIKRTDTVSNWYVWDTARGIVTGNDPNWGLNTPAAEVTTNDTIDPDSTGFIVNQVAATDVNVNAATYIYLAIA